MVDQERRQSERKQAIVPVEIDAEDRKHRVGVSRDASVEGMLIVSPSRFEVGDEVDLTLIFKLDDRRRVKGRVIRVERTPLDSTEMWSYRFAIHFTEPLPELAERDLTL